MPNRLAGEASPYLRDHAENPVDWYPWGDEALSRAKAESKPIFLSIGYSACHWCHVMARESFSDARIAEILNAHYVSIKVDREERPDLDELYVEAVRVMTGSAGWPLSVFLTPELKPFYGGTYFPPEPRRGLAAFDRVLLAALHYYRTQRHEIDEAGNRIVAELNQLSSPPGYDGELDQSPLRRFYQERVAGFDAAQGGFGVAPKFPHPVDLLLLLRLGSQAGFEQALPMVELTLRRMAAGGICDQLGGGFHRYSTDSVWLVPHFEKMLYDNALLAQTYTQAFVLTGKELYRTVALDTLDFMVNELALPAGGFAGALDADTDGKEGACYVWTQDEVQAAVGPNLASLACDYFGVSRQGNLERASVLHRSVPAEQLLQAHHLTPEELGERLRRIKQAMLEVRARRTRPRRDDKVLADWNGLTLSALACAAGQLGSKRHLELAEKLAGYLMQFMVIEEDLVHFRRPERSHVPGLLPDYAFVVQGLLDLYEAGFELRRLESALRLSDRMVELFRDPDGGFFTTRPDAPGLVSRVKNALDGATPSGNSVAVMNLLRLARLCGRDDYERLAVAALRRYYGQMQSYPGAFGMMLAGLDFLLHSGSEVVLFLPESTPEAERVYSLLRSKFDYYRTLVVVRAPKPDPATCRLIPMTDGRYAAVSQPTAYVCQGQTCLAPVHTGPELESLLAGLSARRQAQAGDDGA